MVSFNKVTEYFLTYTYFTGHNIFCDGILEKSCSYCSGHIKSVSMNRSTDFAWHFRVETVELRVTGKILLLKSDRRGHFCFNFTRRTARPG